MNPNKWIHWFEENRQNYQEPDWETPCHLPEHQRLLLAVSLATFQLGETGGGTRLRRFARTQYGDDPQYPAYLEALDLFIEEENYHAELLSKLVRRLEGQLLSKHWTNRVFRQLRCFINLEFNIQVLLTAELIAEAYYGLLSSHGRDPLVKDVSTKILRDEVKHIGFHLDFFRDRHSHWLPLKSQIWSLQFQLIFSVVRRVVWIDRKSVV